MEMELSFLLGALLLLLPLLVTKWYKMCTNRRKLPPGPMKLPFLGNLHQLIDWKSSELLPHRTLAKLASKHGPLMHMKLGERSAIIVSSPQMVREVMRKNDLNFSNRPVLLIGKEIFYDHADMGFRNYGDFWVQMRKICMQELLSNKNIQSFYPKMFNEISNLVSSIKADSGSPINLTETMSLYTNWVICNASVGRACKNQGSLVDIMRTVAGSAGVFDLADLFPSVKIIHFFSELKYKLRKMHGEVDILLEEIINEHEFQSGSTNGDPTEEDIVDVLLRLQKSQDFPIPITRDNIKALIIDLFSGGSTTSASTMEWTFSELMRNPKIMKKAQDEVREVLKGKANRINQSDIQKLKYLKMVVKETLRFHPLAPLLAPRESREECEINGYVIPKGTMALVNFWAISRDPNYWQNPETFDPERFNESHLDFTGAHSEFTPFGSGRRICPGQSFAMATVELCLALLLYHFDWKLPNGMKPNELDMAEKFGNTLERKNNLYLIPLPYVHA